MVGRRVIAARIGGDEVIADVQEVLHAVIASVGPVGGARNR